LVVFFAVPAATSTGAASAAPHVPAVVYRLPNVVLEDRPTDTPTVLVPTNVAAG